MWTPWRTLTGATIIIVSAAGVSLLHWDPLGDSLPDNVAFVRELISKVGTIRNDLFYFREFDGNHTVELS